MPKDPLFEDGKPDGDKKPETKVEDKAPAGVTQADLEALSAGLTKDLGESLGAFGQRVAAAIAELKEAKPGEDGKPKLSADAEDALQQLLADPATVIKKHVRDGITEVVGPWATESATDRYDDLVERHRTLVDKRFGPGAFDEHIFPELEGVFGRLPVSTRGSAKSFAEVVSGIRGREPKLDALLKHKADFDEKQAEAAKEEEVKNPPAMLGRGMQAPRPGQLSADEQQFMAEHLKATGVAIDKEETIKLRDAMIDNPRFDSDDYAKMFPPQKAS